MLKLKKNKNIIKYCLQNKIKDKEFKIMENSIRIPNKKNSRINFLRKKKEENFKNSKSGFLSEIERSYTTSIFNKSVFLAKKDIQKHLKIQTQNRIDWNFKLAKSLYFEKIYHKKLEEQEYFQKNYPNLINFYSEIKVFGIILF